MAFQGDSIYWVEVEKVVPNPFQPRREFDESKLKELSESIRMYGVLQPLTVTRKEVQREDGTFFTEYELIAGERRLRASKLAGTKQVPVIIREGEQSEQEKLELAIIENLQREDLNAVDRALAFRQLADAFGLSHAQVAEKVGRSREYVSNSIRLLGLPSHMLESLKHAEMSEGHARTLLMLNDKPEEQEVIFKEILLKKLSVREVERIVRKIAADKVRKKNPAEFDEHLIEYEKQFTETLGTRVQIQKTDFGGKLTIDYFSDEDLEAILKRVTEEKVAEALAQDDSSARLSEHTPLEVAHEPQSEPVPEPESEPAPMPPPYVAQSEPPAPPVPPAVERPSQNFAYAPENLPQQPVENEAPRQEAASTLASEIESERFAPQYFASAMNQETETEGREPEVTPETPQPHQSDSQSSAVVNQNEGEPSEPTPVPSEEKNDDESGLYSIRNFSV